MNTDNMKPPDTKPALELKRNVQTAVLQNIKNAFTMFPEKDFISDPVSALALIHLGCHAVITESFDNVSLSIKRAIDEQQKKASMSLKN